MSIDKIGSVNGINDYTKVGSSSKVQKNSGVDSLNISSEAQELNESKRIRDMVNQAPDVRQDRVQELKAKINDPDYITNNMLKDVAGKLLGLE
jgi:negative regulator of flagellin synthesis FlgM